MGARKPIVAVMILLIAAAIAYGLYRLVGWASGDNIELDKVSLPLLAIAGVIGLLVSLALVSISFAIFDLSDKTQALALPEGSVRAVLALSLVVIFSILSVFLYSSLATSSDSGLKSVRDLTEQEQTDLLKTMSRETIAAVTHVGSGSEQRFTVYYREPRNPASEDFAKQLLVMIGTLVTSVSSFYFGTRAVTSAQVADSAKSTLSIRSHSASPSPVVHGQPFVLEIAGDNLDLVKEARITQGSTQVVANRVTSNANTVRCEFPACSAGTWDIAIVDASGRRANSPIQLAIV